MFLFSNVLCQHFDRCFIPMVEDGFKEITYLYKYGFSLSMLTELMGSNRNQVVNVNPFS